MRQPSGRITYQMMTNEITPLEPGNFFSGIWLGEGELIPHPLIAWLVPKERIHLQSHTICLTDKSWIVEKTFEFSSGRFIERKMFVEIVSADRLHVTADDMPSGANISLHERGFRFTPYYILGD